MTIVLFGGDELRRIERKLDVALALLSGRARLGISFGREAAKEEPVIKKTITWEEKVPVSLSPRTAAGHAVAVDGVPTWVVTSGDATVAPEPDGLSAWISAGSAAGDSTIAVSADADLGQGVVTITEQIVIHVSDPLAQSLGAEFGAAVLK